MKVRIFLRGRRRCISLSASLLLFFLFLFPGHLFAAVEAQQAEEIVNGQCSTCHRFSGEPKSKFELKAPDLMWGGVKYQRSWLVRWLTGKEEPLYPNGYRWDVSRHPDRHMVLSQEEAEAVAGYMEEHFQDPRVKKNPIDLSNFTEREAAFGAEIYKQYSCQGCHQIVEDGKKVGGPISANLYDSGNRYTLDWLYRFALNPQDFTPHSGEYLADLSGLGVRYIVGYLMTLGVKDYKYFEPWKTEHFQKADAGRGGQVYKKYCTQCHGPKGEGDGPGASGLNPKPAVHAKMALDQFPEDYLYNVIYYGGKSVGKSSMMPDWGLTIPPQDMADLIAYLRSTFKGGEEVAAAPGKKAAAPGDCPQPRKTKKAPSMFLGKKNPLKATSANIKDGELLFQKKAKPLACAQCHGKQGNGKGALGAGLTPKPRNFTCSATMGKISDGQMFWVIKNGSDGTGMMAFKGLKDKEVWKLILYIREFAK